MSQDIAFWDEWNRGRGPKYPHEKVIQFCFQRFPRREDRIGKHALDLGCGNGANSVFLADEGFDVTAVDFSPEAVRVTRNRLAERGLRAEVRIQNLDRLELKPAAFDVVICIGVLDSAGPIAAATALHTLPDAMRNGGAGLFMFAGADDFRIRGANEAGLHGYDRSQVENLFSARFRRVWIDRYSTSYGGGEYHGEDWLVTVEK